jgi:hypothetical protein
MSRNELEWKYASYLATFSDCPSRDAKPRERMAFRFVWNPLAQSSFIPVAFRPPRRANRLSCSHYGLSMFATEAQARTRFAELEEKFPEIRKTAGTHLACVSLTVDHGVQTHENSAGHFDLHEFKGVDLVAFSSVVGLL